ncbi:hypothetical protein BEP19_16770 [Ammoniphilus oxalaticus]|uniref:Uncharacterized protein n=2 Tax=Ammoniphilus oxalaticus TaxID=66863 RepID=A0A419SQ91_9BACL|nr:hypothetical protein BEP19_16770 [Ammoniphilus oxalaticus]
MGQRFRLYDLPRANSVKTFEGEVYRVVGSIGIEKESGEVRHITDLYYRAKTVVSQTKIVAKRKHAEEELKKINEPKRSRNRNQKVKVR